jgi:hypothetical protein
MIKYVARICAQLGGRCNMGAYAQLALLPPCPRRAELTICYCRLPLPTWSADGRGLYKAFLRDPDRRRDRLKPLPSSCPGTSHVPHAFPT